MNFKLILSILFISSFTLMSCSKKCVECADCPAEVTLEQSEVCESDFDNKDEYDQAVAVIEAFGCDCK
jgi:hypothetical protein